MSSTLIIAAFLFGYIMIASERVPRVPAALGGAALMFLFGMHADDAFFSKDTGIDWNVIFLLLGMMIIVGVVERTGLFDYLGIRAVALSKGRPTRLLMLLVIITAVASSLLDNVTAVLLIAQITLVICKRLEINPVSFLLAEVFASNIGGAATLIGDPPNIIIASRSGLTFNDFLAHMLPLATLAMLAYILSLRFVFPDVYQMQTNNVDTLKLNARSQIRDTRLMIISLIVLAAVLIGFGLHSATHIEPSVVALLGAGALLLLSRSSLNESVKSVEWDTLVFFMGLFIMVGGLVKAGVIHDLADAVTNSADGNLVTTAFILLTGSAFISGIVDNIPYVAAMSPLALSVITDLGNTDQASALWWVLAAGADFGGNATVVGASANVVMLGIAAKAGYPIGFWQFSRKGIVVTLITLAVAIPYFKLRYFM